jgi:hypothetical protein
MVRQIEPGLNTIDPAALERRVLRLESRVARLTRVVRALTAKIETADRGDDPHPRTMGH